MALVLLLGAGLVGYGHAGTFDSIADGNYNNPAIWSPTAVPTFANNDQVFSSNNVMVTDTEGAGFLAITNGTFTVTSTGIFMSGSTTIGGGTLSLQSSNYTGGINTDGAGGTLNLGTGVTEGSNIFINPLLTVEVDSGTATISGNVSNFSGSAGPLTKTGAGTLVLSGTDNFSGATTVQAGTLRAGSTGAFSPNSFMTVTGTLDLDGFNNTVAGLAGNGTITNSAPGIGTKATLTDASGNNTPQTFGGSISDGVNAMTALTLSGGNLTLTQVANFYTGGTTITNAGLLQVSSDSSLGTGTIALQNGELLATASTFPEFDNNVSLTGLTGNILAAATGTTSMYDGTISDGTSPGALIIGDGTNKGTVDLEATNSYSGGTTVQDGSTLRVYQDGSLGNAAEGVTLTTGGQLLIRFTGFNSSRAITIVGAGTLAATAGTNAVYNGPVSGGALTVGSTGNTGQVTLDGVVSDTGGVTSVDLTTGSLLLFGANTYSGGTTVSGGTLMAQSPTALGTGAVTVNAGSFEAANGVSADALNGTGGIVQNVNAGVSTLKINDGLVPVQTYAGTVQDGAGEGPLAINKLGSGTELFTGTNTYSGGTTVGAGVLEAGSAGAFGTGLLSITNGKATVGNGNHMIQVGSYGQTGGSLYLNVAGSGQAATADQLRVTNGTAGQAALGGNLTANLSNFTATPAAPGTRRTYTFTLVDTSAGYTGDYSSFNALDLGNGLTASLDYTTDDVLLLINQSGTAFSTLGLTPNQSAILGPINNQFAAGSNSAAFTTLTNALASASNNPTSLGADLNQLSPQAFAQFTSDTAFNNASFETEAMDNYLASQRNANGSFLAGQGGIDSSGLTTNDPSYDPNLSMIHSRLLAWNPAPYSGTVSDVANPLLGGTDMKDSKDRNSTASVPASSNPWNVFVRGNVILAQGFSDPNVSHFDDNTESVELGADYRLTPNFLVGLTAGYAHTDVTLDDNGSSATVDSYSPGFYASYANKGWYANLSGDYLHNAYTQARDIAFLGQTATSAPEGNEGVANLDDGYDFHFGALTAGPLAGVQYTHLEVNGYNETGSVADLNVNESNSDSLRSRVGGRVSYNFSRDGVIFTPHLDATWQHEFLDQSRGISSQFNSFGGGSFSVRTIDPSRDSALADVGFDADLNRTVTLFTDYIVQAGQQNYFGQSVQAGIKIGF